MLALKILWLFLIVLHAGRVIRGQSQPRNITRENENSTIPKHEEDNQEPKEYAPSSKGIKITQDKFFHKSKPSPPPQITPAEEVGRSSPPQNETATRNGNINLETQNSSADLSHHSNVSADTSESPLVEIKNVTAFTTEPSSGNSSSTIHPHEDLDEYQDADLYEDDLFGDQDSHKNAKAPQDWDGSNVTVEEIFSSSSHHDFDALKSTPKAANGDDNIIERWLKEKKSNNGTNIELVYSTTARPRAEIVILSGSNGKTENISMLSDNGAATVSTLSDGSATKSIPSFQEDSGRPKADVTVTENSTTTARNSRDSTKDEEHAASSSSSSSPPLSTSPSHIPSENSPTSAPDASATTDQLLLESSTTTTERVPRVLPMETADEEEEELEEKSATTESGQVGLPINAPVQRSTIDVEDQTSLETTINSSSTASDDLAEDGLLKSTSNAPVFHDNVQSNARNVSENTEETITTTVPPSVWPQTSEFTTKPSSTIEPSWSSISTELLLESTTESSLESSTNKIELNTTTSLEVEDEEKYGSITEELPTTTTERLLSYKLHVDDLNKLSWESPSSSPSSLPPFLVTSLSSTFQDYSDSVKPIWEGYSVSGVTERDLDKFLTTTNKSPEEKSEESSEETHSEEQLLVLRPQLCHGSLRDSKGVVFVSFGFDVKVFLNSTELYLQGNVINEGILTPAKASMIFKWYNNYNVTLTFNLKCQDKECYIDRIDVKIRILDLQLTETDIAAHRNVKELFKTKIGSTFTDTTNAFPFAMENEVGISLSNIKFSVFKDLHSLQKLSKTISSYTPELIGGCIVGFLIVFAVSLFIFRKYRRRNDFKPNLA